MQINVGKSFRRFIWNLAAYRGWTKLRKWNQGTCKHPHWNDRVWGDIHCSSCGAIRPDKRVDNLFEPIATAMFAAEEAYNKEPLRHSDGTAVEWWETSNAYRDEKVLAIVDRIKKGEYKP